MSEENRFSDDGKIHDKQRLKELQALPLERKMQITQTRLIEWYTAWDGKCYVSFSGGKDSTVLADQAAKVCKMLGYKLVLWFSDTGLEYPEIKLTFNYPKKLIRVLLYVLLYTRVQKELLQLLEKYSQPL